MQKRALMVSALSFQLGNAHLQAVLSDLLAVALAGESAELHLATIFQPVQSLLSAPHSTSVHGVASA